MVDKVYCASSYLMYRTVFDKEKQFYPGVTVKKFNLPKQKHLIGNAGDLLNFIEEQMYEWTKDGKVALALSGGIDSAILAKFMRGGKAYTFQCVVPGIEVTNEVPQATKYAEECGLEQTVVPIYWEDFERYAPILMKHKGAPIHSIEVQIYKAAVQAKADGYDRLLFGETADLNYGGMDKLLSKDWTFGEFVERYSYVNPMHAMKDFVCLIEPFIRFEKDGRVDVHEFLRTFVLPNSMSSYLNACECAGILMESPYLHTWLTEPLDYNRIRGGEGKYIIREVFKQLYPKFEVPPKIPMPRPMNEWFKNWDGPSRPEFWPHCTENMDGDQKWLVWCLEKFFDMMESSEK